MALTCARGTCTCEGRDDGLRDRLAARTRARAKRGGPPDASSREDAREPGNDASCTQRLAGKVRGVPLPVNPSANDSATSDFRSGRASGSAPLLAHAMMSSPPLVGRRSLRPTTLSVVPKNLSILDRPDTGRDDATGGYGRVLGQRPSPRGRVHVLPSSAPPECPIRSSA